MSGGLNRVLTVGQLSQGMSDLKAGAKTGDAGDTANAIIQILTGLNTAFAPIGDFTGITNLTAASVTAVKIARDYNDPNKTVDPNDLIAIGGNLTSVAIALGKNHPALRALNVTIGVIQVIFGTNFFNDANGATVDLQVQNAFNSGLNWFFKSDPLILDLDGDGVELTSSSNSVLFDHNADGIKTGTQWAKSDDAMLVRDLNGNGTIDSGRELFGDQTQLPSGAQAANGFAALAALDSNADGVFDASDAAYTELRLWRDLNQDGISQAGELQTLEAAGVTSITWIELTDFDQMIPARQQTEIKSQRCLDGICANSEWRLAA